MSYQGIELPIRIGRGGLMTDENPKDVPDTHLLRAMNADIRDGIIQKDFGSRRWNSAALASPIVALLDYFPTEDTQRFVAITRNGKVWKYSDAATVSELTAAASSDPTTLLITQQNQVGIVAGGQESPGESRKLFIFSGNNQIQVIEGDGTTRRTIENPAADWDPGSYPKFGILHRNRLWGFLDHIAYASDDDDHEQFTSGGGTYNVYPGEGERMIAACVYKKRLFVFKKPGGVYVLIDDDSSPANWYFQKVSEEFGAAGPLASVTALDDLLVANASGGITSYRAVEQSAGEVSGGDILSLLKISNYIRAITTAEGLDERRAIYFEEKKIVYFAFRSAAGLYNDRVLKIDMSRQRPEVTVSTKDQVNCFALRKVGKRKIPFYGAEDGYIYEMDRQDRNVGGSGYTLDVQTPWVNFGYADPKLADVNKIFDHATFEFIPSGRWDLTVEYYIDGIYITSFTVPMSKGAVLDDFELDTDRLSANVPRTFTRRLKGWGKSISFRMTQAGTDQNVKITGLMVGFRPGNQNEKKVDSGRT